MNISNIKKLFLSKEAKPNVFLYVFVFTALFECKTKKRNNQCEGGQPMKQTRGLFCMCESGAAGCQSEQPCHF